MRHVGGLLWIIAAKNMTRVSPASQLAETPLNIQGGGQHTNRRYENVKIVIQQYYFNSKDALHVLQHQDFLSGNPHGTV